MKKILIVVLALFALQVTAQDKKEDRKNRKEKMEHHKDMDPIEMAKIKTKKMTLALDLSQDQQNKVEKLNIKNAQLRKVTMEKRKALKDADKKPTPEEKLKKENDKLDHLIATKREMKKILNAEQYEKYSKMAERRMMKGKHGKMKHKKGGKTKEKRERKAEKE
ncbi:hypothetical protein [Lacinutrix algicola]|uniref:hypothetical protein n=1 Tax=Lacinutrix algicola TaxID=342954 RepID=UPI0006E34C83|nr:hypothetical protein [Lacinutrix algicola]